MHRSHSSLDRVARRLWCATVALTLLFATAAPAYPASIFIDPGHGGRYSGAVSGGVAEDVINLAIARSLATVLTSRQHRIAMSRNADVEVNLKDIPTWHYNDDDTVGYYADGKTGIYNNDGSPGGIPYDDLQARCDKANAFGADVFVSIHCDSVTSSSARGTATYRDTYSETDRVLSDRLATLVQSEMIKATQPYYTMQNDGTKAAGFYVVRWSNMPAILVESAFLSNTYERGLLTTPLFRLRLATGIANGIEKFLAEDPFKPRFPRLHGSNRYATAVALADEGWPEGADTVLLASGVAWPDALAAAPLSAALDAPLLLTDPASLSPATSEALGRFAPERIVVLGGDQAVSTATVTAATEAAGLSGASVQRIAGANRYETAALIASRVSTSSAEVMLVNGESFPDALSASAHAAATASPILLTRPDVLPASAAAFLAASATETTGVTVVGGPAVVSETVVTGLQEGSTSLEPVTVTRLAGSDRYATNVAVMRKYWGTGKISPYVATAADFPDALCAGALAGRDGAPLMLLGGRQMMGRTREFLANNEERLTGFTMVGGPTALAYLMDWQIEKGLGR
jgi:N-acetylmuramoyl-L-alanine amidase/putative cell wall-binding protein